MVLKLYHNYCLNIRISMLYGTESIPYNPKTMLHIWGLVFYNYSSNL